MKIVKVLSLDELLEAVLSEMERSKAMLEETACEMCGEITMCMPFGEKGALICYTCGMKRKEETDKSIIRLRMGPSQ
jgi:hypothetical protein